MNPKREFYLAKTPTERLWYAVGVPYRYWRADPVQPAYLTIPCGDIAITGRVQQQWLKALQTPDTWQQPSLVIVGSTPTDATAMHVVMDVVKQMCAANLEVSIQAFGDTVAAPEDEDTVCAIGHNILPDLTPTRAQQIRDWVTHHNDKLCVLVVAGNPLEIALNRLHQDPNAVILLDDSRSTTVSRA